MSDPLREKAFAFALRIVKLADHLQKEWREFTLSKKMLDAGVNIGLFIEEARQGEDRADFRHKYSLANKEAFKANYLLRLIHGGGFITEGQFQSLLGDCEELQKMLVSALKTIKRDIS
ncbi:MAG: four helix bundle protein [Pyrinomonadaceae bacterium]